MLEFNDIVLCIKHPTYKQDLRCGCDMCPCSSLYKMKQEGPEDAKTGANCTIVLREIISSFCFPRETGNRGHVRNGYTITVKDGHLQKAV